MRRRTRSLIIGVVVVLLVVLLGGRALVDLYTDLLWFQGRGYQGVFWRRLSIDFTVRAIAAVVGAFVVLVNGWFVARRLGSVRVRRRYGNIEIAEQIPRRYIVSGVVIIALLAGWWLSGVLFDGPAAVRVAAWLRQAKWGVADPLLGHDISFYLFSLPVYYQFVDYFLLVTFWSLALVALGHLLVGGIRWEENRLFVNEPARAHLVVLTVVIVLLLGVRYWLGRYSLVLNGNGIAGGIGFTDVHARLPAHWILAVICVLAAATLLYGVLRRIWLLPVIGLGALLAGALLLGDVYPSLVQKFQVEPNELARESPYIRWNLEFTRRAFSLEGMQRDSFPFEPTATPHWARLRQDLGQLALWDPEPLQTTYNQVQALYDYYRFHDVDYDRYLVDGQEQQVAIAAREFSAAGLPADARTWQSIRLNPQYLRGAGVVMSPVAISATEPEYWLHDIPVQRAPDAPPEVALHDPDLYFGEQIPDYAILIPGRDGQFTGRPGVDFPAGVQLSSFLRVLAFSWRFGDKNLLFSGEITRDSRFVFHRSLRQRVAELAPFLLWDRNPYPVIQGGRIVWLIDGYTATGAFPMGRKVALPGGIGRAGYLRNSVKAVVDAVTGKVSFYALHDDDPVLETYRRIFPDLIRPISDMPETLRRHLRYPALALLAQVAVLQRYHLEHVEDFYAQRDMWAQPVEEAPDGGQRAYRATYAIMRMPGDASLRFVTTMPFIAAGRQNMTALLVARNDPNDYGQLTLYELPRDQLIPGPTQVQTIMEQDPVISAQLSLWRQAGSDVDMGHLRVVPLDSSFLYVVPLYLSAQDNKIPQLRRIVVSDGRTVTWGATLPDALDALRSGGEEASAEGAGAPQQEGAGAQAPQRDWPARALQLLESAERSLRAGDWAGYGTHLKELRALLEQLNRGGG
ncbi:MAG: UPF0182 family protein [Gemmatimonadota bacterium]|jgi:uncharacterized protein